MMFRFPVIFFFIPGKVRKVDNPGKVEFIGRIVQVQVFSKLLSDCTERNAGNLPFFIAYEQNKGVLFCTWR